MALSHFMTVQRDVAEVLVFCVTVISYIGNIEKMN